MQIVRAIIAGFFAVIGGAFMYLALGVTFFGEGFLRLADWISVDKSPWWGKPLAD